jgi:hypothetical protein
LGFLLLHLKKERPEVLGLLETLGQMQLMALNALLLFDAIFIFFLFLVSVSCLLYYLPLVPPSRSSSSSHSSHHHTHSSLPDEETEEPEEEEEDASATDNLRRKDHNIPARHHRCQPMKHPDHTRISMECGEDGETLESALLDYSSSQRREVGDTNPDNYDDDDDDNADDEKIPKLHRGYHNHSHYNHHQLLLHHHHHHHHECSGDEGEDLLLSYSEAETNQGTLQQLYHAAASVIPDDPATHIIMTPEQKTYCSLSRKEKGYEAVPIQTV